MCVVAACCAIVLLLYSQQAKWTIYLRVLAVCKQILDIKKASTLLYSLDLYGVFGGPCKIRTYDRWIKSLNQTKNGNKPQQTTAIKSTLCAVSLVLIDGDLLPFFASQCPASVPRDSHQYRYRQGESLK